MNKDEFTGEEIKEEEKETDDIIDDIMDTLDLKSPESDGDEKEESEEGEKSEEKSEETSEKDEEEIVDEDKDGEDLEGAETEEEEPEVEEEEEVPDLAADLEEMKEQNRKLLERLEKTAQIETAEVGKRPEEPPPETSDVIKTFLGDDDIDEVVSDPKKFEAVLNRVAEVIRNDVIEQVFRSTPQLVTSQIQQQTKVNEAVKEFYKENEDLKHVKKTVGAIANDVAADNPDWTLDKVFKQTAVKTRETLGLKKKTVKKVKGNTKPTRKPALQTNVKRANRPDGPSMTETEKDVMDTLL